jgi:hypothetical protein
VEKYQERIVKRVGKLDKEYSQLKLDKTVASMPSTSGNALQLVLAHSAAAVKDSKTAKIKALIQKEIRLTRCKRCSPS